MFPFFLRLFGAVFAVIATSSLRAEDFEALSRSPIWEVRYCLPGKLDPHAPGTRAILERLCRDEVPKVANHNFRGTYLRSFVVVDRQLAKAAFARGDFDIRGMGVPDRKVFETPEFWRAELERASKDSARADAAQALGLCGTPADVAKLSEYLKTENPYVLFQLAVAFHRLGDTEKYLAALDAILARSIKETFAYHSGAIDCLWQTHPDRAKLAWEKVHAQFEKATDLQPEWIYYHIVQGRRLNAADPVSAEDFDALSKSPIWQVRSCVPKMLNPRAPGSRAILERLCPDPKVAFNAFYVYSQNFVVLDRDIVKAAFSRGDFDIVGFLISSGREVFETPEFWTAELKHASHDEFRARAVRALGMCGAAAEVATLSGYVKTQNPELLFELAVAFHRLGDTEKYLATMDALLALPIAEAFPFQNQAIDCLLETHPNRAKPVWKKVHEQFQKTPGLQPGWIYTHVVQENRLPK